MRIRLWLAAAVLLTAGCDSASSSSGTNAGGDASSDIATTDTTAGDTAVPDTLAGDGQPSDTATGDTTAGKTQTCGQTSDCILADCVGSKWANGCGVSCLDKLDPAHKARFDATWLCLDSKCKNGACANTSNDSVCLGDCAKRHCAQQLSQCVDRDDPATGLCGDAVACMTACNIADKPLACWDKCWNAVAPAGQAKLQALAVCVDKTNTGDPMEVCGIDAVTCLVDGKAGSKQCYETLVCVESCVEKQGTACVAGCVGASTAAAQLAFKSVAPCLDQPMSQACMDAYIGCANPQGTATCGQTLDCIGTQCANSDGPGCPLTCAHQASAAAGKKLADLMLCLVPCENACKGDAACKEKCATQTCQAQFAACQGNK